MGYTDNCSWLPLCFLCALAFIFVFWIPSIVIVTTSDDDSSSSSSSSSLLGLPLQQVAELYSPKDMESTPLRIDETLMNLDANPCEDFVSYSCGRWIEATEKYRKLHPTSFSMAQQNAVGTVSGIIALEKSRTWSPSPLARFHNACVRTRADPRSWGSHSVLYRTLLGDVESMPLNAHTLAELMGRMTALGMDTPISVTPMSDPTDTINGGWVLSVVQAGIVGGGEFANSKISALFKHRNAPHSIYAEYARQLEMVWRFDDDENQASRVKNAMSFMRKLGESFVEFEADSECWIRAETEQQNWASYFQQPECYARDRISRDKFANASLSTFEWAHFVNQLNAESAWSSIRSVWTPQGRRWLARVLNPRFASAEEWRDYLCTSVRYGALQHYFAAEWASTDSSAYTVGIVSPIISQVSGGGDHSNWKRAPRGAHFLKSRRKTWVPQLESRRASRGIASMSSDGANNARFVSETLCTDLTFLHLQPLVESYFLQALGLDDQDMRNKILSIIAGGVDTLKELVRTNVGWTSSTREFFTQKLETLIVAVGSPPYAPLGASNVSAAFQQQLEDLYAALVDEPEALVQNMLLARRQRILSIWSLNKAPRGGTNFDMPLWEINAFFDPTANSIALLAGILQPPFFSRVIEQPAILYARMLAIIGHELGHGLDPNGRMADWSGSVVAPGYWEDGTRLLDRMAFADTEQCLIDLYDGATTHAGNKEDGVLTLSENMADHIGLRVGYNTMIKQLAGSAPLYKLQQEFMLGWAQSWCMRLTSAQEEKQIESDVHALFEFRIAKPLSDMPEFARAFKCSSDTLMGARRQQCKFF